MPARADSDAARRGAAAPGRLGEQHYRELHQRHVIRLLLTYVAPLIALTVYFQYQYKLLLAESSSVHVRSTAENLSNTLDLFLQERIANLINLFDDPKTRIPPSVTDLQGYLERLRRDSDTFVDIGYFDARGIQAAYAGPVPELENRDYSQEPWYQTLRQQQRRYVITDNYLGFRNQPHFTIAVSRQIDQQHVVLRVTLDPRKMVELIDQVEGSSDVLISVINGQGIYQLVKPQLGKVLETSPLRPPEQPLGVQKSRLNDYGTVKYGYAWLHSAHWAVLVQYAPAPGANGVLGLGANIVTFACVIVLVTVVIICFRAKKLVETEQEKDTVRFQLEHAAKLASLGELAAGIAHEINNPLAIIASEAGLMRDLMDPEFSTDSKMEDLTPPLENIREAVYRCRDITGKLLRFVRQDEVKVGQHDVHQLIDETLSGFLEHELTVSNIQVVRNYCDNMPLMTTDGNQFKQVLLNIINNANDAITVPGTITLTTEHAAGEICIAISDTGKGIAPGEMEKLFLPFYTTKEVGEGTGLGLSVSYGIIRQLGGTIDVESTPGRGSTFTIRLPAR